MTPNHLRSRHDCRALPGVRALGGARFGGQYWYYWFSAGVPAAGS
jgi:hypothetical protein